MLYTKLIKFTKAHSLKIDMNFKIMTVQINRSYKVTRMKASVVSHHSNSPNLNFKSFITDI